MRVQILMDELKNAATSTTGVRQFSHYLFIYYYYLYFLASNPPLRIIHARISNNLNKDNDDEIHNTCTALA